MATASRKKQEKTHEKVFDSAVISMKPVYRKQKAALNSFHALIGMMYIYYATDGLLKPDNRQKKAILLQINNKLNQIYNDIGSAENETVTDILRNDAEDMYGQYSTIYGDSSLTASEKEIDSIINTPIDKTLYSDRIWKNKEELVKQLKKAMDDIMQGKTTIDKAGKEIEKIFDVSAYQSKRLLETELTRVQAQAMKDIAKKMNVKKVMWSATFENSCEYCIKLDGKVFDIDKVPPIPAHPNCKCILLIPQGGGK